MYLKLDTMTEVTENDIRSMFPDTSFPTPFVVPDGFAVVFATPSPTVTELQVAVRNGVVQDSKGNWVEDWLVKDKFADVTNPDGTVTTKAEQENVYLAQLADAKVPKSVTQRQARIALLRGGMLDAVTAAVTSNQEWAITWEFATEIMYDNPLIDAVLTQLGKTKADKDALFTLAATL